MDEFEIEYEWQILNEVTELTESELWKRILNYLFMNNDIIFLPLLEFFWKDMYICKIINEPCSLELFHVTLILCSKLIYDNSINLGDFADRERQSLKRLELKVLKKFNFYIPLLKIYPDKVRLKKIKLFYYFYLQYFSMNECWRIYWKLIYFYRREFPIIWKTIKI